jgi:ABC-type transport system involved in multi-copper enzyme maturation permease subunit
MAVFLFDLLRTTRRGRLALVRGLYGLALLAALGAVFLRWFGLDSLAAGRLFAAESALGTGDMGRFAAEFTTACLFVQLTAVLVLTPAYAAGAVAEERQRRTLDDLLATNLPGAAIVFGKLAARWLHVVAVLFVGLPVFGLTQWWGGTDPPLLLAAFAVTALAALSLAALSLLFSVQAQTVLGAVSATYLVTALFCTTTCCLPYVNPFFVTFALLDEHSVPGLGTWRYGLLVPYAAGHLLLTALLGFSAVYRLRARDDGTQRPPTRFALRPKPEAAVALPRAIDPPPLTRVILAPPVDEERPLLWKERYFGAGAVSWELYRLVGDALLCWPLFAGIAILATTLSDHRAFEEYRRLTHGLVGFLTLPAMALIVLGAGLRAAGSVSRERERKTLDSLLTMPDGRDALLRAKWLSAVIWCRRTALGLLALWVVGALTGAVRPVALPLLLLALAAHVGCAASVGLYLSVTARGTGIAIFETVVVLLAACGLPWLAWSLWDGLAPTWVQQSLPWLDVLLWEGLWPPATWWRLTGQSDQIANGFELAAIATGLVLYAGAAGLIWWRACVRFVQA